MSQTAIEALELLDSAYPNEGVGYSDANGQWVDLGTVADMRTILSAITLQGEPFGYLNTKNGSVITPKHYDDIVSSKDHYTALYTSPATLAHQPVTAGLEEVRAAIKPFADAARVLGRVAPDGIDDHVTVIAHIHVDPTAEYVFSSADFTRALAALKSEGHLAPASEAVREAAANLIANRFDHYKARNGKLCSIDGEKCWLVSFDDMATLEAALRERKPC